MPDDIYRHIGAAIRQRRRQLGLKQRALASQLGISRGSLANIEIGRQGVLVHQLYRFAAALQLTPTELLPQPKPSPTRVDSRALPLPSDLKPVQRDQIARLIGGDTTDSTTRKERKNAKRP